jgi:hypothetical protein
MTVMTDNDPAFLWETEALRESPQRVAEIESEGVAPESATGRWATLREASRATGIPVETLRKWARRGTIPTHLTATPAGPNIRMVDLDGIERRAGDLGRTIRSVPPPTVAASDSDPIAALSDPPAGAPAGTMIVPVDAWNKMLNQLGNLHEAGQQLAEARERAAKAETEATFLRERLAELRHEPVPLDPGPPTEVQSGDDDTAPATEPQPEKVWQFVVRRFRDRGTG